MTRRILAFLLYAVMICGGFYLVGNFFLHGGRWIAFIAGGMLILFPLYLMWEELRDGLKGRVQR
jgi:hypothetical protein